MTAGDRVATGPTTDPPEPTQPVHVIGGSPAYVAGEPAASRDVQPPAWVTVGRPADEELDEAPLGTRRVVIRLVAGIVVVLVAVTIGGSLAARRLAEREAVNDSAAIANVLAETVVQPALTDGLLAGDESAQETFDELVRDRVLGNDVVRVKIWGPDGKVLYADQPELIGRTFPLDAEEREVLGEPRTVAEISDLDRAENALDRDIGNKLVEVYRPVWTESGQEALFEIYTPYEQVSQRTGQLWRGFAGVTLSSLLLFVVLLAPLVWHLISRARRDQRQRELLLQRAVDASDAERRRIAATLHDGPVQDLAASSFVIAGATANAESMGRHGLAEELRGVAGTVRASIRALRTLLVDIYPPSLAQAGLAVALPDLAQTVRVTRAERGGGTRLRGGAGSPARPGAAGLPGGAGDPAQRGQACDAVHRPRLPRARGGRRGPRRGRRRAGLRSRSSAGRPRERSLRAAAAGRARGHTEERCCRWPLLPGAAPTGACVCIPASRPARHTVRRTVQWTTTIGRVSDDQGAAGR